MGEIRYYEDVEIGEEFRSRTRTITETDVVTFASLSDDWSEVHISDEFAKGTAYGRRIAHGLLGLAITEGLKLRGGADRFAGIASLGWTWDFRKPVFLGDTVHVRCRLRDKRTTKDPGRGIFFLALELVNQRGEVVHEGEHRLMVETRKVARSAYTSDGTEP
jgi:acyl dehydratase